MTTPQNRRPVITTGERIRFIMLAVFAVGCFIVIFSSLMDTMGGLPDDSEQGPAYTEPIAPSTPTVDAKILEEVRDDLPRTRVMRERIPFRHLRLAAGRLVPGSLERMGLSEAPLDYPKVLAAPATFRGRPVWVKAQLQSDPKVLGSEGEGGTGLGRIEGTAKDKEGRLYQYSMTHWTRGRTLEKDAWVVIKGLFFKLIDPFNNGSVVPLIVGQSLKPSWERWAPVTELDPAYFHQITDDAQLDPEETEPEPFYHYLSFAQSKAGLDEAHGGAERLDEIALTRFRNDPEGSRGDRLVTFYINTLRQAEIKATDENPLGLKYITRIWGGSSRPSSVIRIIAPGRWEKPEAGKSATGIFRLAAGNHLAKGVDLKVTGVFFRNLEYETNNQRVGRASAPIFIATRIESHQPQSAQIPPYAKYIFVSIAFTLALIMVLLVIRDRKRHAQAEQDLVQRRKSRREKQQKEG